MSEQNTTKHLISIENCKCFRNATVEIFEGALNIKYGPNGTGKSTIAQALQKKAQEDKDWLDMIPYCVDPKDKTKQPKVSVSTFSKVAVFNEEFAKDIVFTNVDITNNSLGILVKNEECARLEIEINADLHELQDAFSSQSNIQQFLELLNRSPFKYPMNKEGTALKKVGGLGNLINGDNGCFRHPSSEMTPFLAYYSGAFSVTANWAKWRKQGVELAAPDCCPYCAEQKKTEEFQKQNSAFDKEYSSTAMKYAQEMLEYLNIGIEKGYIDTITRDHLDGYIGTNRSSEMSCCIFEIQTSTTYISEKLESILNFGKRYISPEQIRTLSDELEILKVDPNHIGTCYNTEQSITTINAINRLIDNLKLKSDDLRERLGKYNKKIEDLIEQRQNDINHFLSLAGFPYEFTISTIRHEKSEARLVPIENRDKKVDAPQKHLSWGEKNAFSLVMFMFIAVKDNADLIVLDDPITAFDKSKKFAVVGRLFEKRDDGLSLFGKSVLLLTHDLQPIIDYIFLDMFARYNIQMDVNASYLLNNEGILFEKRINSSSLNNTISYTKKIASESAQKIALRIVSIRKYIEYTVPQCKDNCVYNLTSNLIHGRSEPQNSSKNKMEQDDIDEAESNIQEHFMFGQFSYESCLEAMNDAILLDEIARGCPYEQTVIARVWMEREDGKRLSALRRVFPEVCKFINESNHVENDYIFQLDPLEYPEIPENYLTKLLTFIQKYPNIQHQRGN